jgi:hypothetical protein
VNPNSKLNLGVMKALGGRFRGFPRRSASRQSGWGEIAIGKIAIGEIAIGMSRRIWKEGAPNAAARPRRLRVTMSPEESRMSIPGRKLTLIWREAKRRETHRLRVRKDD